MSSMRLICHVYMLYLQCQQQGLPHRGMDIQNISGMSKEMSTKKECTYEFHIWPFIPSGKRYRTSSPVLVGNCDYKCNLHSHPSILKTDCSLQCTHCMLRGNKKKNNPPPSFSSKRSIIGNRHAFRESSETRL